MSYLPSLNHEHYTTRTFELSNKIFQRFCSDDLKINQGGISIDLLSTYHTKYVTSCQLRNIYIYIKGANYMYNTSKC